jgi:phage host-nuclease inhibitor protein Gam
MGFLSNFEEEEKTECVDLVARYDHLKQYAQLLEVADDNNLQDMITRAGLEGDITDEKLDRLQMMIENAAARKDAMFENKHANFEINSADSLDWYFKQQVTLQAQIAAVEAQFKAALAPYKADLNSLNYMFQAQAEAYARARYAQTGKKTEVFPHGTIKVTTYKPSVKIEDESKLQEWLGNLEALSRAKFDVFPKTYSRNLDALKEAFENGSKIPGLVKDPGGDKLKLVVPV